MTQHDNGVGFESQVSETRPDYRTIADFTYDWEYWEDPDGSLSYVSPSCKRITGYPPERFEQEPELLGKLVLAQDRLIWDRHHDSRQVSGSETIQFRMRRKDGELRWIEHACRPVQDPSGSFLGYRVSNRDITRRMEATEELRKHGLRLEELLAERAAELEQANLALLEEISERKLAEGALRAAKVAAEEARREEAERRREAETRRRIAESLGDILTVLNSNRPLDQVLDYIAVKAGELLGAGAAGIYRLEGDGESLPVPAQSEPVLSYVAGADIRVGQGALMSAIVARAPVAVADLCAVPEKGEGNLRGAGQSLVFEPLGSVFQALLAVPIIVRSEAYGGLLLSYGQSRDFSDEEIELAAAFGDQIALAIGNARLREQIEEKAAAAERERLARDLHDAVTQTLFSATLIAEAMPRVWETDPEQGRRGLEELRALTRGAAAEMRTLVVELRPTALTEKPLGELLRQLADAMRSRARVPIDLRVQGTCVLPPDVQIALYRIAQESLNNVAKHAAANQIWVALDCSPGQARLSVRDDGGGFDPGYILPDRFGVAIMGERAAGIGAVLDIGSERGQGTQITVKWRDPRGIASG